MSTYLTTKRLSDVNYLYYICCFPALIIRKVFSYDRSITKANSGGIS